MLRVDTAAVRTIAVQIPGDSYTLTRQDTAWTVDGERASTFRVTSILEELAGFRGIDFLVPGDSMYALAPAITITALGAAGDTMTVLNLSEGERDRRGTVRDDSIVYRVPNFRIDRVAPNRETITAPPS